MIERHRNRQSGVALVVVLALVVILTMLTVIFFVSVTGESSASQHQASATQAQQIASSASQMVMAQVQAASSRTQPSAANANNAVAWTSQPGLLRSFTPAGASTVYKLYSATNMVTDSYAEGEDAPPPGWRSQPGIYSDLNAPISRTDGSLAYPVADPLVAAVSLTSNLTMEGAQAVPGFSMNGTAPGYSGSNPSPANNPLPMPVRWLYILKDGQLAAPESADANGTITFAASEPQPSDTNPVVGRVAFWADDETCKVNINTAGYAKNDNAEWTFWDSPAGNTKDENDWLSWAQPWTKEYSRYPGHPATTGLNVVFDLLNLTADQTLVLTPKFLEGGTKGGTVRVTTPPTTAQIDALKKDERLFPTIDEMFYNPTRGAAAAGISQAGLEARRFLITATSRAPETTLFDTPRVTIWPTWQTASKRTAIDRLIAFSSTIAPASPTPQPFYFVREDPLSSSELTGIPQNLNLWSYLQTLSNRTIPGFGGNFGTKFGTKGRDQILTSLFDAIRLANLDDRSGPGVSGTSGWSFTAGELRLSSGQWASFPAARTYTGGYVAPSDGPNGTRAAGRTSALAEVAFLFARGSNRTTLLSPAQDADGDGVGDREIDQVKAAVLYGFYAPAAGFVQPGQSRRVRVTGLSGFRVRSTPTAPWQQLFANDVYDRSEVDAKNVSRRELGGRIEWTISQMQNPPGTMIAIGPPTANLILPIDTTNPNANPFIFSGGTLVVEVYSPATAPAPYQTYSIVFPQAEALTPLPVPEVAGTTEWAPSGRWMNLLEGFYELRLSHTGDTLLAMQNRTGDFRSEVVRSGIINDFRPHHRYGKTDLLTGTMPPLHTANEMSRRASLLQWSRRISENVNLPPYPDLFDPVFGQLISGFNGYASRVAPVVPSGGYPQSIQDQFPPGDFSSGPGAAGDGSLSPKTDEGAAIGSFAAGETPYFRNVIMGTREIAQGTLASPNRQMPSAVFLGSIPSGVYPDPVKSDPTPWRTLLFRPARAYHMGGASHFGSSAPADYLMLDWFHMPVVEPYAISEPLSTAGKINLNTQIIPFGNYVRRQTALHALLRSARVTAIPERVVGDVAYAAYGQTVASSLPLPTDRTRYPIDEAQTIDLLRKRFEGSDGSGLPVYLTNAEICSVDLVPQGFSAANLAAFWADKRTTGDNLREAPYATLLPRLTAKSNSFTVHITAQALAPGPGGAGWQEGRGKVLSEWRGAMTIERYVDPNDRRFTEAGAPDFLSGSRPVGPYYRFRVLGTRRFNP